MTISKAALCFCKRTVSACLCLVGLTVGTSDRVWAEGADGLYASVYGGIGSLAETNVSLGAGGEGDVDFDPSFTGGGAIGYAWSHWRLEGEITYRTNETSGAANSLPTGSERGDFSSLGIAVNALREFDLIPGDRAKTYLGLGLVYVQEIDIDFELGSNEVSFSDSELGVQLIGGAAYRLGERWDLLTDLRYLPLGGVSLDGEGSSYGSANADYDHWSLNVGLRFRFR